MTASNVAVDKKAANAAPEKAHEKLAEKRRALGRGLDSLLPGPRVVSPPIAAMQQNARADGIPALASSQAEPAVAGFVAELHAEAQMPEGDRAVLLELDQIGHNPYQTRREFEPHALDELAASIQTQGVLQPIIVRPAPLWSIRAEPAQVEPGAVSPEAASPEAESPEISPQVKERYMLILGERRFRASKIAGKTTIPAIVKRVSEQQAAEMTLVENLQRQDLNCVEQAEAFANLSKQFKMTQEDIGKRAGVSREQVSNYMRLLSLPEGVIGALQTGKLTYTHARTLLHLRDNAEIWKFAQRAIVEKMSVAKLEDLVLGVNAPPGEPKTGGGARWVDPNVKAAQRSLEEVLGMRVRIQDRHGRGKIVVEYGTIDDFDRVVRMLKGK
jgi:ParB family transcriptional regulator, chromosome partitioning protein